MTLAPRQWLMVFGLLATLVLVFSMEEAPEDELLPASRPAAGQSLTMTSSEKLLAGKQQATEQHYLDWGLLQGRAMAKDESTIQADLFKPQRWYIPLAKTAAELAPLPLVVPQPSFAYIGKLEDGPQGTIFLLAGASHLYSVGIGEHVDRAWRLDKEDEQNLHLTYLPLNVSKILPKKSKLAVNANPASHLPGNPDDLQGNL